MDTYVMLLLLFFSKLCLIRYDEWEIDISQVEILDEIGQGAFGKVWKGKMDSTVLDKISSSSKPNQRKSHESRKDLAVAVKMLHG